MTLPTGVCLVAILGLAPLFGVALARENWLLVGLVAMVAFVPVLVRWPVVSTFGLYAFIIPFESVTALSRTGGATLPRLLGLLAAVVLLTAGLVERRFSRPPLASLWWGLLMVWAILSVAWAIDPDHALQRLNTPISLFLLYLIAVSVKPSRKELYYVCLLVVAGGVAAAVAGYLFGVELGPRGIHRGRLVVGDQASNPNSLGAVLILPLALAAAGVVGSRNLMQKLLSIGAVCVIGAGVFITMSRGALLSIAVTMLVFVYRSKVRWQSLVAVAMLLAMAVALPQAYFERAGKVFTGEDATGAGRTRIWKEGIEALGQFGIFGAGHGNYTLTYNLSDDHALGGGKGAHNTYLAAWVELGIPGLVLLLAALGTYLWTLRKATRENAGVLLPAIEAAAFGILAGAFFADRLWSKSFWLLWILVTWAIHSLSESQQTESA
jgi:O-antigen ligase